MSARRRVFQGSTAMMVALAAGCASSPSASNLTSNVGQLQGGAGLVSSGGGNGTSSLISNNAGGLISNNAGGLISNNAGGLISNNAGGLISNNAGGLISNNAGGLISNNAGGLTGTVRGPASGLISNNAGGLISNNAGGLISNNAGGLISNNAGGLVSNNAGGLVSNNAGGLISNNAGGFKVLDDDAAPSLTAPIAGAKVAVFDEHGEQLSYAWTTTDEQGNYTFGRIKASGSLLFVRAVYNQEGQSCTLLTTATAPRAAGLQQTDITPATTLIAKKLDQMIQVRAIDATSIHPAAAAELSSDVNPVMSAKAVVAAAILPPVSAAATFDNMLKESPTLAALVAKTGSTEGISAAVAPTPVQTGTPSGGDPAGAAPAAASGTTGGGTPAGGTTTGSNPTFTGGSGGTSATPTPAPAASATAAPSGTTSPSPAAPTGATVFTLGTVTGLANTATLQIDMPTGGSTFTAAVKSGTAMGALTSLTSALKFTVDPTMAARSVAFEGTTPYYLIDDTIVGNGQTIAIQVGSGTTFNDLAVHAGFAYVTTAHYNCVYKVSLTDGTTTVFAATPDPQGAGFADGAGEAARFSSPQGICFANNTLYVADFIGNRIRAIDLAGNVTTVAGSGGAGSGDALGTAASFNGPADITTDGAGNLYVAEELQHHIRKIDSAFNVTTVAGGRGAGDADGIGSAATLSFPTTVAYGVVAGQPVLVVGENNKKIRLVSGF